MLNRIRTLAIPIISNFISIILNLIYGTRKHLQMTVIMDRDNWTLELIKWSTDFSSKKLWLILVYLNKEWLLNRHIIFKLNIHILNAIDRTLRKLNFLLRLKIHCIERKEKAILRISYNSHLIQAHQLWQQHVKLPILLKLQNLSTTIEIIHRQQKIRKIRII